MLERKININSKRKILNKNKEYSKESFKIKIHINRKGFWKKDEEEGDMPVDWEIIGTKKEEKKEYVSIFKGEALLRDGKMKYYYEWPSNGEESYKIEDFKDKKFKKRSEIISKIILKYVPRESF